MHAIVADDDRATRTIVRRLLELVGVSATEAENGLELLALLDEPDCQADLILLDLDMPLIDGAEVLRAIRSSPSHRDIAVVCISGVASPKNAGEIIGLGVQDFLVKPLSREVALPRIRRVLRSIVRRQSQAARGEGVEVLIVDPDPNFLAFAQGLLSGHCVVSVADSPVKAAARYGHGAGPAIVVVSTANGLLSGSQLVEVLRRLTAQSQASAPEVYLLTGAESESPEAESGLFHGVLSKSFVPEVFLAAFRRTVLKVLSLEERLVAALEGELRSEIVSATQQTIGVMANREVAALSGGQCADLTGPIRSTVFLAGADARLELSLVAGADTVRELAATMLGAELSLEEGAADVLSELINTLAGRIRASLLAKELDLAMGLPISAVDDPPRPLDQWPIRAGFESADGHRFGLGLAVSRA